MKKSFSLEELAKFLGVKLSSPEDGAIRVSSLSISSKEKQAQGLFIAIKGDKIDGHDFIDEAAGNGARAYIGTDSRFDRLPGVIVKDARVALSKLASLFFDNPSSKMELIGVTGTNGKTTLCSLLYNLYLKLGFLPIRLGTLGVKASGINEPGNLTTPEPITLNRYLSLGLSKGVNAGVMEVSSHGLSQHRADDIEFNLGIYTNLSRDHLDYHRNMESYYLAKLRLFQLMSQRKKGGAVVNIDCPYGQRIVKDLKGSNLQIFTYGSSDIADIRICDFSQTVNGCNFSIVNSGLEHKIMVPFIGFHNALNISAACGAMLALGHSLERVISLLPDLPQVPGRLEAVQGMHVPVFVDYAHTPDALENVLSTLKPLVQKKLWLVFGCGGDRDRGKRSEMGKVASAYADEIIVTSDNPRTENPLEIVNEIVVGISGSYATEIDRRKAIRRAVKGAEHGDLVLIAGKGHEDYQIIGAEKFHFSDVEEVKKAGLER